MLNNVSDEDSNTCNRSGSHRVDSVPSKSTVEDLDTHGIYKGSEDISDHREMNYTDNSNSIKQLEEGNLWQHHLSPGSIDGLEVKGSFESIGKRLGGLHRVGRPFDPSGSRCYQPVDIVSSCP